MNIYLAAALLEIASGLPYGVVNELVPVWLKVQGASLETLGLLSLIGLPWSLKAVWAPIVDRYGNFKAWMIAALLAAAVVTAVLPGLPLGPATAALLLMLAFASATQDIAIDGTIAMVVPKEGHGRANGIRIGAYRGGMLAAGGGATVLGDYFGWNLAFLISAGAMLLLVGSHIAVPPAPRAPPQSAGDWTRALGEWVGTPGTLGLFALALLYKLGDAAMAPMVKPFWLDAGLSATEVGAFSTTVGALLTVAGALIGGEAITRYGLGWGLLGAGAVQAISNLGYTFAAMLGTAPAIYTASAVESFCGGLGTAALLATFTRAAVGAQAATRFALLSTVLNLTRLIAGAISGFAAARLGYGVWFALTAALALPGLVLAAGIGRRIDR